MTTETITTSSSSSSKTKRIILLVVSGILLLLIFWLGLKTWRLYQVGQNLLTRKAEVETLMAGGLTNIDPDIAESMVMDTREDIKTLKRETAVFMPVTPYLGWVPKVGSTLVIAPTLMEMAESGMDAAAFSVRGLKPVLTIMQSDAPSEVSLLSQISGVINEAGPDLAAANEKLTEVASARTKISNSENLPWQLQTLLTLSDEWLPFAQDGLALTAVLPQILGENEAQTYLLIAQNEDELRPSGGFISGGGTLIVENGGIESLQMVDAYTIDNWKEKPYDYPPQPFNDYMGIDMFFFRDSNYWPDFPTTAEKAMDLYSYGQDQPPLDGVIAIDQEFIRLLVDATGPIYIEENNVTINPEETIEILQNAWSTRSSEDNLEWIINRKAFIGVFATAIINHIQNNFASVDPIKLAQNIKTAVEGKHIQLYLRNPEVKATLDNINWDGRLEKSPSQDFLAVVDMNMGFNKANINIDRSLDYHVTIDDEGKGNAQLNITYSHTGQGPERPCIHYGLDVYDDDLQYIELAENCYWNYLRVYVPEDSQLISSSEHHVPAESIRGGQQIDSISKAFTEHPSFTTWDNFLMVPYAQSVSSSYHYLLPKIATHNENGPSQYQLTVRKQAGTNPESATISVTLPDNVNLIETIPNPSLVDGNNLFFDMILDTDKNIFITYK